VITYRQENDTAEDEEPTEFLMIYDDCSTFTGEEAKKVYESLAEMLKRRRRRVRL
jgi:hypothetical protein